MKVAKPTKTKNLRKLILEAYFSHLEMEGRPHPSVRRLCRDLKITEKEFYAEFPSLGAIEKDFWREWMENIISAVSDGKEWKSFTAKEQYLAFLFAFTGEALAHRSLLDQRFGKLTLLCGPSSLEGLRNSFKDFAGEIIRHGMEEGTIAERGPLGGFYPDVLYIHWRSVLEYFLKDESRGFERTDAFIEKTVELAFDLLRTQAIDSAADLARFLLPQIVHPGGKS